MHLQWQLAGGPPLVPSVPLGSWVCVLAGSLIFWSHFHSEHTALAEIAGLFGVAGRGVRWTEDSPKTPLGRQLPEGNSECFILASITTFFLPPHHSVLTGAARPPKSGKDPWSLSRKRSLGTEAGAKEIWTIFVFLKFTFCLYSLRIKIFSVSFEHSEFHNPEFP